MWRINSWFKAVLSFIFSVMPTLIENIYFFNDSLIFQGQLFHVCVLEPFSYSRLAEVGVGGQHVVCLRVAPS